MASYQPQIPKLTRWELSQNYQEIVNLEHGTLIAYDDSEHTRLTLYNKNENRKVEVEVSTHELESILQAILACLGHRTRKP